jgi:hypothetical protein
MSAKSIAPIAGAVSITTGASPSAFVADFMAFTFRAAQGVEGVTPFGSNTCSKNLGAGTPDFAYSVSANALYGAAGTAPGLPGGTAMFHPGASTGAGVTVLTLGSGILESFPSVIADFTTGAARMRAAVPEGISGKNSGDCTETWATS